MTTDNHFNIDRRQFLLALGALGATVVLPSPASDAQVNDAWVQLVKEPWYFEVDEYGTIGEADDTGPEVNMSGMHLKAASSTSSVFTDS